MRRFVFVLTLTAAAQPAFGGEDLFDRFKLLCIDTGADPAAVSKAAEAAGGVKVQATHIDAGAVTMIGANWKFAGFDLESGIAHIPSIMGAPAAAAANCVMHGVTLDGGALARLREWAGVPADKGTVLYTFLEKDGKHLPVHLDIVYHPEVLASGHAWELRAGELEDRVVLTHYIHP